MISKIIIVGAGALGREVFSLIEEINGSKAKFEVLGFLDDEAVINTLIRGKKVLGTSFDIGNFENAQYVIAVGNCIIRKKLFDRAKECGAVMPNLIHPLAKIDNYCKINWDKVEGNIICANAILSCDVLIGNNNLINVGSILSHDTVLGNNNTIMQGCILNGFVTLKDNCFVRPGIAINGKFEFHEATVKVNMENY
jgi:UDP-3-O-[3-hydroxymyristoyl] glucosamine N-acyltransferase